MNLQSASDFGGEVDPLDPILESNFLPNFDVPVALELALIRIFAVFQQHDLATAPECNEVATIIKSNWSKGVGADPLEALVKLRLGEGEDIDHVVEKVASEMAQALDFSPLRIPFVSQLIPPTSFYERYPSVAQLCELMLVPVTYNEDADVIGLTSINPHFAEALSGMIIDEMKTFSKVRPIINVTRADHSKWKKMCQKHFRKVRSK